MKRPLSIRARFFIVSLISVPAALALAALFMVQIFADNLEDRLKDELTAHSDTIAAALQFAPDGGMVRPQAMLDRRFTQAYGGLYWQVEDLTTARKFRSESLWDFVLPLAQPPKPGDIEHLKTAGPEATKLLAQDRVVTTAVGSISHAIRITVAMDMAPISEGRAEFIADIVPHMIWLGLFLIAASLIQLTFGLKPLRTLTDGLNAIRERRQERLEGDFPSEFTPMTAAVNRLLESQSTAMRKARSRAGDLAHGLKTPLTVLANDALTLRERGETDIAEEIERISGQMKLYVDRELTRSRIAVSADMRQSDANPLDIASQIVRTLKRTPQGERIEWQIDLPADLSLPIDPHDLRELLGNLLENASKWANHNVHLFFEGNRALVIEDDGPGVSPALIETMTARGVRLDQQVPGSGIGLAIVRDICEVYGLGLEIENRSKGGLKVTIRP